MMLRRKHKYPETLNKCFGSHFDKYLGTPTTSESFQQNIQTPIIRIISYDNVFRGCRAFCSIGLSSYRGIVGEYAEIFMPVDRGWNETLQILASALFYIIQSNKKIGWGLSIRFADLFPDFVKTFDKSAIYFTIPYEVPEGFNNVKCNGVSGFIYLACYISETEHQFFVKEGTEKFDELLEQKNVDMFNISRPSMI